MVGKLVKLGWFAKHAPRPKGDKWDNAYLVVEDNTMIIATDPANPYPAGNLVIIKDGQLEKILIADVEVVQ
tara:strand:- start:717 stop:929 length:213 start_codon:yes stop_codon:yes gene_type:complete